MRRATIAALAMTGLATSLTTGALPASGQAEAAHLTATMTAEEEVPVPGPPGGKGDGTFEAKEAEFCYAFTYSGISEPTAGHIHKGAKGVAGDVVIDLKFPASGDKACVPADGAVIDEIVAAPQDFYANIHTAEYPAGAIRGQLAAGGDHGGHKG
ncbi:MAG: CHRD domain-containing protein [Acidimicrobiia bacterium]